CAIMLRMNFPKLAMVLMLAWGAHLRAQLEDCDKATQAKCAESLKTPLPAEAVAVSAPNAWPECDSLRSYSGIGGRVDFEAARRCAWSERLAIEAGLEPRYSTASVFGGSAMLSVLYANGQGVARNIPLAIRFACEAGGAPAEIAIRVKHIESLHSQPAAVGSLFQFCDDITSGFMQGFCAAYDSEIEDQKRANSLDAVVSRFTTTQRSAFNTLRKLEEDYAHAHAKGEIDLSGTARAMYQIDAQDTVRDDFVAALKLFEVGRFPTAPAGQYADADARLNRAYHKALNDAEEHKNDYGAVQPEGIRDAERAWLKYRDAWIAFAKLRYPAVPAEAWLALLTGDRTSILDGSFCDMDAEDGPCAQKGDTWKPSPLP
ncbi:MAG: lysozyme inhibitor LprI family protein, partial [Terracidiphilus sp.]